MAKVIQIQYVPRSKRQRRALLIALDDQGAIWFGTETQARAHRFDWTGVDLPDNLEWEDEVEIIEFGDVEMPELTTVERDLKTKEAEEKDG